MMRWRIEFLKGAEKDIARMERSDRRMVIDKLEWLGEHFDVLVPQTLGGEYADFYKLRVLDWRVKYMINWHTHVLTVCYIDRRDKAYKKKKS